MSNKKSLSHIDAQGQPTMVDVSDKVVTKREALAQATLVFPEDVYTQLIANAGKTAKGSIIDTAIIAGVMGAKKTHELIPFCHSLALDNCKLDIEFSDNNSVLVKCAVKVSHKTGVEMEALTGVTVAALTIYDMCKALSHDISITNIRLLNKSGGKSQYVSN